MLLLPCTLRPPRANCCQSDGESVRVCSTSIAPRRGVGHEPHMANTISAAMRKVPDRAGQVPGTGGPPMCCGAFTYPVRNPSPMLGFPPAQCTSPSFGHPFEAVPPEGHWAGLARRRPWSPPLLPLPGAFPTVVRLSVPAGLLVAVVRRPRSISNGPRHPYCRTLKLIQLLADIVTDAVSGGTTFCQDVSASVGLQIHMRDWLTIQFEPALD